MNSQKTYKAKEATGNSIEIVEIENGSERVMLEIISDFEYITSENSSDALIIVNALNNYKPTQPPAISSNEGETVEQAADIAGKEYYSKEKPANTYTFHEGFKAGSEWKSQYSYTERELIAIIEQVKKTCADRANTEIYDSNNIVDKQSITDIDFKYLLK